MLTLISRISAKGKHLVHYFHDQRIYGMFEFLLFTFFLIGFFTLFGSTSNQAYAQGIIDLGALPGDTTSVATAINNSDVIVGISDLGPLSGFRRGVFWVNGQIQSFTTQYFIAATGINSGGTVCGTAWDHTHSAWLSNRAVTWHNGIMTLIPPDPPPAIIATHGFGINDSGWVVGDRSDTVVMPGGGVHGITIPFIYKHGLSQDLPRLAGGYNGYARAINNHGIAAGYASTGYWDNPLVACVWFKGKIFTLPTSYTRGLAFDINDNNVVAGVQDDGYGTGAYLTLWNVTIVNDSNLQISGATIPSYDDRWVIVTNPAESNYPLKINNKNIVVTNANGGCGSYLYNNNNGQFTCLDSLGIDISPFQKLSAGDINDSGHIVGSGLTGLGYHAFLMNARYISVSKPAENDLMVAGEENVIRWNSVGVDYVDIYYKFENEESYHAIALHVPAMFGEYSWSIPDSILERKVKIRVEDVNSNIKSESKTFRIKGYVLTRVAADGEYEQFRPNIHGWNILNDRGYMWPTLWWVQFDYDDGNDPLTGRSYPSEWTEPPINAQAWDFPDWQLIPKTFGLVQSYYQQFLTGNFLPKPSAVEFWRVHKGQWGGSCYGFAMSSFLAFDRKEIFRSHFGLPDFTKLFDVALSDNNRLVNNQLMISQWGAAVRGYCLDYKPTPVQTLHDVKAMFISESNDNRAISIIWTGEDPGGHTINPYKVMGDPGNPAIARIYVYDSNRPGDSTVFIAIDTVANTWRYDPLGWTGNRPGYCMLELPASTSLEIQLMDGSVPTIPHTAKASKGEDRINVYTSPADLVQITNLSTYQTIGYNASTGLILNLPDAKPIIPLTGTQHQPIGYMIPSAQNYGMNVFYCRDSIAYVTIWLDSVVYTYSRANADSNQGCSAYYTETGCTFGAVNVDSAVGTYQALIQSDSSERVYEITCPVTGANHSYSISVLAGSSLRFANPSEAQTGTMMLKDVSSRGVFTFKHDGLQLDENTAYTIIPDWDSLTIHPIKILIDHGQDGTVEDSTFITGEVTDIGMNSTPQIPLTFALHQNYPNPFNPSTLIGYQLPIRSYVSLKVFDLLGREVAMLVNNFEEPGYKTVEFNPNYLSSGMYFYRIDARPVRDNQGEAFISTKKLLLVK